MAPELGFGTTLEEVEFDTFQTPRCCGNVLVGSPSRCDCCIRGGPFQDRLEATDVAFQVIAGEGQNFQPSVNRFLELLLTLLELGGTDTEFLWSRLALGQVALEDDWGVVRGLKIKDSPVLFPEENIRMV